MSAVADCTEFMSILVRSRLIEPARLQALKEEPDFPDDHGAVAEKLIRSGDLTRFQAKALLAGKHRGFRLGHYKILDQIGKGGMGTVFLGEHAGLNRKLAIKVLAKELSHDAAAVERFQREARAASVLAHPNIVRVHHFGQEDNNRFLVMEYVQGATLEQILDRKGPFTVIQAVRIAMQAAAGLYHAHEKGFVHRDIKPENLMLTKDGTVKILDMGLTKSFKREEDNLTGKLNTTLILGTIDYLSPEQAMNGGLDQRSDIYSLGATLFAIITGHTPYEGVPARQKLMQHQCGAVPDLTEFNSDVPKELAAVVSKMMAKRPNDRFTNMAEVVKALTPWAELGETGPSVPMPSGITIATAVSRSMTPTVRDTKTASQKGSFVVVAPPTPIARSGPEPRKSPAASAAVRTSRLGIIMIGLVFLTAAAIALLK